MRHRPSKAVEPLVVGEEVPLKSDVNCNKQKPEIAIIRIQE
jgi:hypothetical protein